MSLISIPVIFSRWFLLSIFIHQLIKKYKFCLPHYFNYMLFSIGIKLRIKNYNRLYFTLKCTSLSRISFNFSKYNLKGSLTFQKFINFPPFYYIHYQVIHYIIQIIEHVIVPIIFFHYVLWFLHATPCNCHC